MRYRERERATERGYERERERAGQKEGTVWKNKRVSEGELEGENDTEKERERAEGGSSQRGEKPDMSWLNSTGFFWNTGSLSRSWVTRGIWELFTRNT